MKKRILSLILALCMVAAMATVLSVTQVAAATVIDSGTCGATENDNVTWSLDSDGTMTIGGTGAMADYKSGSGQPWADCKDMIKKVVIADGVTRIGACAFENCSNLTSVAVLGSIGSIGAGAFSGCSKLESVAILQDVVDNAGIGGEAFYNCTNLKSIYFGGEVVAQIDNDVFENAASFTAYCFAESNVKGQLDYLGYTTSSSCFTVTGGKWGTDYDYDLANGVLTVLTDTPLTIKNMDTSTPTSHRIVVKKDVSANITLAGVNIENSSASPFEIAANSTGNVTVTLKDGTTNTLKTDSDYAALQKEGSGTDIGTLTIGGTGTLIAESHGGAGIGGNCGGVHSSADVANITITGGKIAARSIGSPGIGSGCGSGDTGSVSGILITGGTVTAECTSSSAQSAGIGGGFSSGKCGTVSVRITGGTITAKSVYGAGIGQGISYINHYETADVIVTGGSVSMTQPEYYESAGITVPSPTVTDGNGNNVYLYTFSLNGYATGSTITVNGVSYPFGHTYYDFDENTWKTEKNLYIYSPESLIRVINGGISAFAYNGTEFKPATIWLLDSTGKTVKGGYLDLQKAVNAAASGDIVQLLENITLNATVTINTSLTLDLSGHMLKMTGSGSVLKVGNGTDATELTLIDKNGGRGSYKFKENADGLWIADDNGDQTVTGGVITGGGVQASNVSGGGVYIANGSSFTMSGGSIVGCKASSDTGQGGGVYVGSKAAFIMSGGTITGCQADQGGGVFLDSGIASAAAFTMSGGTITNCTAQKGSAIYMDGSSIGGPTMDANGGTVDDKVELSGKASIKRTTTDSNIGSYTKFLGEVVLDSTATVEGNAYPYVIKLSRGTTTVEVKVLRGQAIDTSKLISSDDAVLGWYYTEGETTPKVTLATFLSDGTTERTPGTYALTVKVVDDELDALDTALAQLKSAQDALENALANKADTSTLNTQIDAVNKAIKDLQTELAAKAAQTDLDTLKATVTTLKDAVDALNAAKSNYSTTAAMNTAIKNAINEAKSAQDTAINELKTRLDKAETDIKALDTAKASATDLAKAISDLATLTSTVNNLSTTVSDLNTTVSGLSDALDSANTTLQNAIDALTTRVNTAESNITDLTNNKASKDELTAAVNELKTLIKALDDVKDAYKGADTALKDDLQAQINSANTAIAAAEKRIAALESTVADIKQQLENAKAELNAAIARGDKNLSDRIAALNTALEDAKTALEKADADSEVELSKAISDAQSALQAAIDKVASDLASAKAELEAKNNAQDAKDAELEAQNAAQQTFITVVCIIACLSLAGNVAIVTTAFILKRKRTH